MDNWLGILCPHRISYKFLALYNAYQKGEKGKGETDFSNDFMVLKEVSNIIIELWVNVLRGKSYGAFANGIEFSVRRWANFLYFMVLWHCVILLGLRFSRVWVQIWKLKWQDFSLFKSFQLWMISHAV